MVVLDIEVREPDPFETCAEIRGLEASAQTPVLFVTEAEDAESVQRAYEAGVTDFVTKPLNPPQLSHRVLHLLRTSRAFSNLRENQERLARAQRLARLAYWDWDVQSRSLTMSTDLADMLGDAGVLTTPTLTQLLECVHPMDRDAVQHCFEEAFATGSAQEIDHRVLLPDRRERVVRLQLEVGFREDGEATQVSGTLQDVTEHKQAERQISRLAYSDTLTGLSNRRCLSERIPLALGHISERGRLAALLLVDLDRFNRVNEGFGHPVGDQLLKDVAQRLLTRVRMTDYVMRTHFDASTPPVSRLGGDEFAIFLAEVADAQQVARVGHRLFESLRRPFVIGDREVCVTASIGIAVHPMDGRDFDTLLRNADAAMHHAKAQGGNNLQFYTASMNATASRRLDLENQLRKAIERDELLLHYQPKVELRTRRLAGLEALLRWQHPELGSVPPAEFIPLAEEGELILEIGEWVLRQVCEQSRAWRADGFDTLPIAVNLSRRQIGQSVLAAKVGEIVSETGLQPADLEFEVTESAIMHDEEAAVRTLKALKEMGSTLSLDDFGTGYSSLTYLRRFPIDVLKIDRSFVKNVAHDPDDAAIVAATIAMARSLQLTVVAEGVETDEQEVFLYTTGCDQLQGFRISPPLPAQDCHGFLPRRRDDRG
jgi:diguanylate cyclase (GGDEF)-like protein